MPPSDKANLARIRDNQRRSRARRREYVQELERKLRMCELEGVQASAEVQQAARKVADENRKLRSLLRSHGVTDESIESFLRTGAVASPPPAVDAPSISAGGGGEANAQRLVSLLDPRPPSFMGPVLSFDLMGSPAGDEDVPDLDCVPSHNVAALDTRTTRPKSHHDLHAPGAPAKKQLTAPNLPARHVRRDAASVLEGLVSLPQAPGMLDAHIPLLDMSPQGPGDYGQQALLRYHGCPFVYDASGSHFRYQPFVLPTQLRLAPTQYATTPDSTASSDGTYMAAQIVSTMADMDPTCQLRRQLDHVPPTGGLAGDLIFDSYP